jgi:hypothetical protein
MAIIASFEAKSVRNTAWDERKGHSLAIRQLKNQKIGVEALLTCEYDQTVVDWTLQHSLNVTDVSLTIIEHIHACLMHIGVQLLPRVSSISRPVDRSCVGLNQNDLIGVTAPHDVL